MKKTARARLSIDLNLLNENIEKLRKIAKNDVIAMLKANAYGHGLIPIFSFLQNECQIQEFGLASLAEAVSVRNSCEKNSKSKIYVFSDNLLHQKHAHEVYANFGIVPVISNSSDLNIFLSSSEFKNMPLYLKFNTGMNRLGLTCADANSIEEVCKLIKRSGRKSIDHLMSHFACASLSFESNPHNKRQLKNFEDLKSSIKSFGLSIEQSSISNSGAIEQGVGFNETHIRPGLMLYGPSSLVAGKSKQSLWNGKIISSLTSHVLSTRELKKGDPCGYGASPINENGLVAILGLGYGDGFINSYNKASIIHKDIAGRIVGRVNMDMLNVLFENQASGFCNIGDEINIWNHEPEQFTQLCNEVKTIPYELFCLLTSRVERYYKH